MNDERLYNAEIRITDEMQSLVVEVPQAEPWEESQEADDEPEG